jgi:catechol 2,3-dioxygenase-like lactoylglutathione lyase family enzyme
MEPMPAGSTRKLSSPHDAHSIENHDSEGLSGRSASIALCKAVPHLVHSCESVWIAFLAESRAAVDSVYAVALVNGGSSEGAPGLRPEYHEHYYGAYFRDPDGNKLCVACHLPQG